jgi:hypothetical protein
MKIGKLGCEKRRECSSKERATWGIGGRSLRVRKAVEGASVLVRLT